MSSKRAMSSRYSRSRTPLIKSCAPLANLPFFQQGRKILEIICIEEPMCTMDQSKNLLCPLCSPWILSQQHTTLSQLPWILSIALKSSYFFRSLSTPHTSHSTGPWGCLLIHPFTYSPYLAAMTFLQSALWSFPNLHNHLYNKALFIFLIDRIPKPFWSWALMIFSQLTQLIFFLPLNSFYKNSLCTFSILFVIDAGAKNKER